MGELWLADFGLRIAEWGANHESRTTNHEPRKSSVAEQSHFAARSTWQERKAGGCLNRMMIGVGVQDAAGRVALLDGRVPLLLSSGLKSTAQEQWHTGDRESPLGRSVEDDKRGGIIGTGGWHAPESRRQGTGGTRAR